MDLLLQERSLQPERMDVEPLDLPTTATILRTLERINAWLGGVRATLLHIERFSQAWEPGQKVRFIDWGTGGADVPRALVRWGRAHGFAFEIVGVDPSLPIIDYAREACRDYPEIRLIQTDFNEFPGSALPFDYALSSLMLHHLRDSEIVSLLRKSDQLAQRGLLMNDLERNPRAWAWIWALSRLTFAPEIVQEDGPMSVRRAFKPQELEYLTKQAGLSYARVHKHLGYRLVLAGEKSLGVIPAIRRPGSIGVEAMGPGLGLSGATNKAYETKASL